ncbi:adaptor protein MecA [Peribacillus alkalitolerans]|uniref:adaptor protein MecA n=1 Tax=Peribacillus alkalitolerans TaxID=1550385 RepID=UPI0013D895B4|nr:adaptor protein MecA [Peribacillus alkalitolerans]
MEIERINEHTVKFYISYIDIEERGFDRDEIWYNREKSEELFWEMMDEVHHEEEFGIEGPLWIQVQALDKGLEVLVTRANLAKDVLNGENLDEKLKDMPVHDKIESLLDHHMQGKIPEEEQIVMEDGILEFVIMFKDFEDVISLSKRPVLKGFETKLFAYEGKYYLFVEFLEEEMDEEEMDNVLSILLEYGDESQMTIHRLEEYGKVVMNENVFDTVRQYFV